MNYMIVFVTAATIEEGEKIANSLIENRLAACVNITKEILSIYRWKEKVENSKEVLLIIKSKEQHFNEIQKLVKENHSYEVPEIIAFPIKLGNNEYLQWIDKETR